MAPSAMKHTPITGTIGTENVPAMAGARPAIDEIAANTAKVTARRMGNSVCKMLRTNLNAAL